MKKKTERFDFAGSLTARMKLMSIERHICQSYCKYDLENRIFKLPEPDHPYWIVERILVGMERNFEDAKTALDQARAPLGSPGGGARKRKRVA